MPGQTLLTIWYIIMTYFVTVCAESIYFLWQAPVYFMSSTSVADLGCLSRIPHPNFSIPDSGSRVKKILNPGFGSALKKLKYFFFHCGRMPLFFVYFSYFITYIHSIEFIQYIDLSPFAEVSLHLLIPCKLSGKNLPVVMSWESNSGLPYSKPTRYQLNHADFLCKSQGFCKSLNTFDLRIFFSRFLQDIGWYGFSYRFLAVLNLFHQCLFWFVPVLQIRIRIRIHQIQIFLGPPGSGSGSISQRYGSRSGSFYHQAKIGRKTLIPTYCFVTSFWLFIFLKMM